MGGAIARHLRAQCGSSSLSPSVSPSRSFVPIEEVVPRILAGWNAGGWLYLVLVGIKMWRAEIEGIKREASIERESRIVVLVVVIFGSIFTMLALFAQLMAIKSEHGIDRTLSIGLSVSTIFLSWLLIHTVFALYLRARVPREGTDGRAARAAG